MFIPGSGLGSSTEQVAIATQDTALVLSPGKGLLSTLDHVIGGKLSCMDCTADHLALGVGSYGYGTLGNKVNTVVHANFSEMVVKMMPRLLVGAGGIFCVHDFG